jgi:hypothetical protein
MNDEDVSELPHLLSEMTRHIPQIDDDLIEHLRGGVEPVEDFHPGNGAGITGIVYRLAGKETYHGFSVTFTTILKYSLLAVQRFCQGDAQVPMWSCEQLAGSMLVASRSTRWRSGTSGSNPTVPTD